MEYFAALRKTPSSSSSEKTCRQRRDLKRNHYRDEMALIVGDDFQHILRVLNTNVDGREKVRRRFRFLLVREWAFGVRMCGLLRRIPGRRSPFWDRAGLFWVESHLETSGKDGTRLARATVLGAVGIFARANASRSSPLDARDAREAAQKALSFFRFFLKTHTKRGELL